jgi:hypothetical protein
MGDRWEQPWRKAFATVEGDWVLEEVEGLEAEEDPWEESEPRPPPRR